MAVLALLAVGIGLLLSNLEQRPAEGEIFPARIVDVASDEIDPAVRVFDGGHHGGHACATCHVGY